MNSIKGHKPATRNDLGKLGGKLLSRMDRLGERVDGKFDAFEKRFDEKLGGVEKRLDAKIDWVGIDLIRLREETRVSTQRVDARLATLMTSEEFQASMDKYFADQEAVNRSREIRADLWRDHERRISTLEGKAPR